MSMVALITLLVIGLISLAASSTSAANAMRLQAEARANAMTALSLAIGELQKEAGPDQRVTATGDIMASGEASASQPYLTGVWESWAPDPDAIAPDYDQEKSSRFRRWLASGLSEQQAADTNLPLSARPSGTEAVRLVGPGTLGRDADEGKHVWVNSITPQVGGASGRGAVAYAVLDEGVKARVNLRKPADDTLGTRMAGVSSPYRNALEKADESLAAFGISAEAREQLARAVNLQTVALVEPTAAADVARFNHSLTTDSMGVLADVVHGGLRRDLSLLGELESLPAELSGRHLYSGQNNGLNGSPADPTLSVIHNFTRLHKVAESPTSPVPTFTTVSNPPVTNLRRPPRTRPEQMTNLGTLNEGGTFTANPNSQEIMPLAPVVARCEIVLSAVMKKLHGVWRNDVPSAFPAPPPGDEPWEYMMHLIYQPVVTLWNPYNVPLTLHEAQIELQAPPIGFQFERTTPPYNGIINNQAIPLSQMYLQADARSRPKRFSLNLHDQMRGSVGSGVITLAAGEVKVFSPYFPPDRSFANDPSNTPGAIIDTANREILEMPAIPGYRGPQYGFWIDWLDPHHAPYSGSAVNGPNRPTLGVIAGRLSDVFDIFLEPLPQQPQIPAMGTYGITLSAINPTVRATIPPQRMVLSRVEFDYNNDARVLRDNMPVMGRNDRPLRYPLRMSQFSGRLGAREYGVELTDPLRDMLVKPILALSAQGKTSNDATHPNRPWIHGNLTRPLVSVNLATEPQAWHSHELALRPHQGSGDDSIPIGFDNDRGYFIGGINSIHGSPFATMREAPVLPVQGVAQLAHSNLAAAAPGLPNVDHAVGQSFAHPLLPTSTAVFSQGARVLLDHSYLANRSLWDSWYASTIAEYRPWVVGKEMTAREMANAFFRRLENEPELLNPRFIAWLGQSGSPDAAIQSLFGSGDDVESSAYRQMAGFQMLLGAFNVNSTSVEAWKALLGALSQVDIPIADDLGSLRNHRGQAAYFSKFRLANFDPPGTGGADRLELWQGGRELDDAELEALARGIVREVRNRGPFLSLGEFVNRRLGSGSADTNLYGALQAAIENAPGIGNLNSAGSGEAQRLIGTYERILTDDDISGHGYETTATAIGSTATGAASALDQLAILTQIGSSLSARSDTFRVRFYGDVRNEAGTRVLARAYGEATVQRVPDYVDHDQEAWTSPEELNAANDRFGRRFIVTGVRWLSADEI